MSDNIVANENFIQDFIDVTGEVLSNIASFDVKAAEVREINANGNSKDITACFDITAVLGFSGGRQGSLLVSFPQKIAFRTVGRMLGIEFNVIDSDVRDGVSELVNIIAGGAKTKLQAKGIDFELSIPNTIIGEDHKITAAASTTRTHVDFNSDLGSFFIEVYLKETKKEHD